MAKKQEEPKNILQEIAYLVGSNGEIEDDNIALGRRIGNSNEQINKPFTVNDYGLQRPAEADPKGWRHIFMVCDEWYLKNGLVRNIIDLMADFCVAGIQVSSSVPLQQAVLRKWFEKVKGRHVSERIANMLYRLGNVGVRREMGVFRTNLKEQWQKAAAQFKAEVKIPDDITDERFIPAKYVTISPKYIKVPSPEIAAFLPEPYYGLQIVKDKMSINQVVDIDKDISDEDLAKQIPSDIREAFTGGKTVRLDNDTFKMLHYKKDDFDKKFAYPLIYAALSELTLYSKMELAERNVIDSAARQVDWIKIGDHKLGLIASAEYIEDITRKVNKASVSGSRSSIVTSSAVDIVSAECKLIPFLGKAKYEPVLEAIYGAFGIPSALTGTAVGGAANNFMSMKVLVKKLEYVRQILTDYWKEELKQTCAAFGFKSPVFLTFTHQELGDESAIKKLIQDMYDREVISDETYRHSMGFNHDLEKVRIAKDRKLRKAGRNAPKAGPYHNANLDIDVKKLAVQGGAYTLEDIGVNLEDGKVDPQIRKSRLEINNDLAIKTMKEQAKIDMAAQLEQGKIDVEVAKNSPRPVMNGGSKPTKKTTKKAVKKAVKTTPTKKTTTKKTGSPGRPMNQRDNQKRKTRVMKAPNKT